MSHGWVAALAAAIALGVALQVYAPALDGPFLSDDWSYVHENVYVREPSLSGVREMLRPLGEPARATANWAPLHLLLHAAEWRAFGPDTCGYHAVNVVLHVGVSALVFGLLRALGVQRAAAAAGAFVFLLHPANVEAVAWISQLKTVASTGLALAALLVWRRLTGAGALLYAGGLLTKVSALFVLPMAASWLWVERARDGARRRRAPELLAWLAFTLAVAVPATIVQRAGGLDLVKAPAEIDVRLRTSLALFGRYLALAATSFGSSTFQQPEPAYRWTDPWWIFGAAAAAALGVRTLRALHRHELEAVGWIGAAAAFLPVAQLGPFAFPFPMADRYLYAMLPGLLAGALLASAPLRARIAGRLPEPRARIAAALAVVAALAFFAYRSHQRAAVWRSGAALMMDAARHYPDGVQAALLRATAAARRGDAEQAAAALRSAHEQGFNRFQSIQRDPQFAAVLRESGPREALQAMARDWTQAVARLSEPPPAVLVQIADAHLLLGEREQAIGALRRALEAGGLLAPAIQARLERLERQGAPRAP